jgi:hypothetical protein
MNDRDREPVDDERPGALLRRAGVVEQDPPPRVGEQILRTVRGEEAGPTHAGVPPVTPLRDGGHATRRAARRPGPLPLLAAAAAGALVTWAGLSLTGSQEAGQVLASGQLSPLTTEGAQGRAEVVEVEGQQRLRVVLEETPQAQDGYLEVWLLRPDVSGMVTLGVLDGQTGEFAVPEGLDLEEFAVVDISREHMDGDPGHGGDSLVRGEVG